MRRTCIALALVALALTGCGLYIPPRQFIVEAGRNGDGEKNGGISAHGHVGQVPPGGFGKLPYPHLRTKPLRQKPTEGEEARQFREVVAYVDRHCPCTFEHTGTGVRVVSIAHR